MGHLTLFSSNEKKQTIKTADDFEFKFTQSKKGDTKRRKTKDEIMEDYKKMGQDLLGSSYVGGSFVSGLD